MARTAIVEIATYDIKLTYSGIPKTGADLVRSFGGPFIDPSHEHVEYDETILTDDSVLKAQDDEGDTEIVNDDAKIAARKGAKWDLERLDRNDRLDKTDKTMVSDAPGEWDDWTTYRQDMRDHIQDLATKDVALDSTVGQDDMTVKGEGGCSCDITIEVSDPGAADQSLTVTVTDEDIKVDLATDSGSDITSTVQDVIDEINSDGDSNVLVVASLKAGATGANIVDTEVAKISLITEAEIDAATWPTAPTNPSIDGLS